MLNIALTAARKAGDIIVRAMEHIDDIAVPEKSKNDFVTEVDKQAEAEILYHIRKNYPSHSILAEESGEIDGKDNSDSLWIIDPLDGTTNFIHGIPHFAISIAFCHKGKVEHGLVYDPVRDEAFMASKGSGARVNQRRIRVSETRQIEKALLTTGLPFRRRDLLENYMQGFNRLSEKAGDVRRFGSAALDLAYVAAGRFDGYWEYALESWDIAAGALLVKESGGYVTDFAGQDNYLKSGNIIAATPKVFPHVFKAVTA